MTRITESRTMTAARTEIADWKPIRRQYWHLHARGFANECHVHYVETAAASAAAEALGFERLTRRELAQHIAWVNAENDAWGTGHAFGPMRLCEVTSLTEINPWSGRGCPCMDREEGEGMTRIAEAPGCHHD